MFPENVFLTLLIPFPFDIQTSQTQLEMLYGNANGSCSLGNMILFTAKSLNIFKTLWQIYDDRGNYYCTTLNAEAS